MYPIVFAVKHDGAAQLEWPNQFVLMYHGVICLYNRANYERFAFATSGGGRRAEAGRLARALHLVLFRSIPALSPAPLVIRRSSRCSGIVYVDAYNDNARPLTHSQHRCRAEMSIMTARP